MYSLGTHNRDDSASTTGLIFSDAEVATAMRGEGYDRAVVYQKVPRFPSEASGSTRCLRQLVRWHEILNQAELED